METRPKGTPAPARRVPVARPSFDESEERLLREALRSGWVTQGPFVERFEREVAARTGAREAVAVSSGTAALFLALHALGLGEGDEVIVPSLSFIAIANVVVHCGATPRFAEIDPRTYNLDPDSVAAAVNPRTRAILVAHQLGLPADMEKINAIALRHALHVIEDAACAIGATRNDVPVGNSPNTVCFSFHPRKVVVAGEGGMITTNDPALAQRFRRLRHQGMSLTDLERHSMQGIVIENYSEVGYNFRLSDLHAAVGVAQLAKLDAMLKNRREIAARYDAGLAGIDKIETPYVPENVEPNYQSYIVRFLGQSEEARNQLLNEMDRRGVATRRGLMAIHREPPYRDALIAGSLSETDLAAAQTLIIPMYADLGEEDQDYVIDQLLEAVEAVPNNRDGSAAASGMAP